MRGTERELITFGVTHLGNLRTQCAIDRVDEPNGSDPWGYGMQNRGLGEPVGNCRVVDIVTSQIGKRSFLLLSALRDLAQQFQEFFRSIAVEQQYGTADLCS